MQPETIFLRFVSREEAIAAFNSVTGADAEALQDVPPVVMLEHGPCFIDVIFGDGVVRRPTGEVVQGELGPEPVVQPVAGFHVNLLLSPGAVLPEELEAVRIYPEDPACVFATETVK